MIEQGIVTFVRAHTPLTALQGTRIYPDSLPQEPTLPATVFFSISDPSSYSHDGQSSWKEQRFQFEAWAKDPLAAITLKNTLRSAFGGFKGMMGATEVYAAFVENGRTLDDDETGVYRRVLEIVFQYKEA